MGTLAPKFNCAEADGPLECQPVLGLLEPGMILGKKKPA